MSFKITIPLLVALISLYLFLGAIIEWVFDTIHVEEDSVSVTEMKVDSQLMISDVSLAFRERNIIHIIGSETDVLALDEPIVLRDFLVKKLSLTKRQIEKLDLEGQLTPFTGNGSIHYIYSDQQGIRQKTELEIIAYEVYP